MVFSSFCFCKASPLIISIAFQRNLKLNPLTKVVIIYALMSLQALAYSKIRHKISSAYLLTFFFFNSFMWVWSYPIVFAVFFICCVYPIFFILVFFIFSNYSLRPPFCCATKINYIINE